MRVQFRENNAGRTGQSGFLHRYNHRDEQWAQWIAWQLEEAGYSTFLQAWDFRPGCSFAQKMQWAATRCERTIAVLSPSYFDSTFTPAEWEAAFVADPSGREGRLLPVRVVRCDVLGLLGRLICIDIVDVTEEEARQRLLDGVRPGRAKRKAEYPGAARHRQSQQPAFPGEPTSSVLSATRERPLAVAAEQRLVQSDAGVNPAARIRRPSTDGFRSPPGAPLARLHAFPSPRLMSFPKLPAIWAGAVAAAGALAIFVAVAPQPSGPKVNKVMVEIFPIGGTYDVYRDGRFLQRIGRDLPPLYIAATEGQTFTIECRTKNVNVAPPFLITAGPG